MDNRFTKKRITNMLSYDWIKMVIIILAIIFFWSLAYTIGAPRISPGQTFTVFYYTGNGAFNYLHTPEKMYQEINKKTPFSYDVLDFSYRELTTDYFSEIMMTSMVSYEGDIMITIDSKDKIEKFGSEFRGVVDSYGEVMYSYDALVTDAKQYCLVNGLVYEKDGAYCLNENKIAELFATRMVKDPRFRDKTGERYAKGVQDEIARIKTLWNNAIILEDCLNAHPEIFVKYARYQQAIGAAPNDYSDEAYKNQPEKIYAVNLGLLSGGEVNVASEFAYNIKDEKGEILSSSADGIVMLVFNFKDEQPHLQYETLTFVNGIIGRYSNFLNYSANGVIL